MEVVPQPLRRYAKAQGWSIRIYHDAYYCLKPCSKRIKIMKVTLRNLGEIVSMTGGDATTMAMWTRALTERPEEAVLLMNAPCRLHIGFASTFTTRVLHRDPNVPFECNECGLMHVRRSPIYCGACDDEICDDCYKAMIKHDVEDALYLFQISGQRTNPVNIYCQCCHSELVGSWADVYRTIRDYSKITICRCLISN